MQRNSKHVRGHGDITGKSASRGIAADAHANLRFCSQGMEHARDPGRSCLHRSSVLLCEAKATGDFGVHPGLCGIGRTYTTYNTRQNVCLAGGVCAAHSTAGNSFSICEVYFTVG